MEGNKNPFKGAAIHGRDHSVGSALAPGVSDQLSRLRTQFCDRGVHVNHTSLCRWIQAYAPEIDKRIRPHLRMTNDSCRVDETYMRAKGEWVYLYRAVNASGQTINLLRSLKRDAVAARRFSARL